jgi:hypothetical protein
MYPKLALRSKTSNLKILDIVIAITKNSKILFHLFSIGAKIIKPTQMSGFIFGGPLGPNFELFLVLF